MKQTIILAGGCFWCLEPIFDSLKGVIDVKSGYSGGLVDNPTYEQVCTERTGHAEAVQIEFDPEQISLEELLEIFFAMHDPTTLNRQGNDVGTQYRSAIFYHSDEQKQMAENYINKLNAEKVFDNPIVTEVTAFSNFYEAEDYHQEFYERNKTYPYCRIIIDPKVEKLKEKFSNKLR